MSKASKTRYKRRKESILRLRKRGKSYKEISKILGCALSTISYHCGKGESEKKRVKKLAGERGYDLSKKVGAFKARCSKEKWRCFRSKVKSFKKKKGGRAKHIKAGSYWRVHNLNENYTTHDVVNKIGEDPVCYLTGRKIDLKNTPTYSLDHRVPTAKGGTNDLHNLEICLTEVNRAKADLSLVDFYKLCEDVLAWRDKNLNPEEYY
jgi:hypothetical protein